MLRFKIILITTLLSYLSLDLKCQESTDNREYLLLNLQQYYELYLFSDDFYEGDTIPDQIIELLYSDSNFPSLSTILANPPNEESLLHFKANEILELLADRKYISQIENVTAEKDSVVVVINKEIERLQKLSNLEYFEEQLRSRHILFNFQLYNTDLKNRVISSILTRSNPKDAENLESNSEKIDSLTILFENLLSRE